MIFKKTKHTSDLYNTLLFLSRNIYFYKDLNKIFYDILIKIRNNSSNFEINKILGIKYFENLNNNDKNWHNFNKYFINFYSFCFELDSNSVIQNAKNFKLKV